jgi:DNA repair and recombination protein RAD54B
MIRGALLSSSYLFTQLRDIFTIHPHTGCHTHDLLDCPCEGRNKPIPPDELDSYDSKDGADEQVDIHKGFISAHQINPGDIEKMDRAVRQFRHITYAL